MAAKNQSNNEKTIKTTLRVMPSDFWTVDSVSLYCNYNNLIILPDGFILDEYRDHFENFLEEIDLDEQFHYSPSLFSQVYYGTPDLDFLVLYFAKIPTLFEFNQPKIKVLPLTALLDLNKLIVESKKLIRESKKDPTVYTDLEKIVLPKKGYI